MGQTPITPIVTSWLTTNLGGYAKRAIAVAMFLLSQSAAGVLGSQLYKSRDGPHYSEFAFFVFLPLYVYHKWFFYARCVVLITTSFLFATLVL